ncbi:NADPH:quinone reductase [Microtetraspora sp. NBRC 13810]|uniref:NAD(P)-dependent alcohol dehydrogenase n=1 Tax=Microtetraspora sp. NBRC 13810 TaxID=3030990 RepID=UPI0024A46D48|nr:NAD(P)-dependent alcohol dehydrogenase [Microtetraspora sp. NBRC 13810]GLW09738.1 NADPH:quinone reductase [Microtetraspora sp. NBRC 13810]
MKAMVREAYCAPDLLELRDVGRPAVGPDDVLVRVRAAGVDQGVWHAVTGLPYLTRLAGFGVLRPKSPVPGLDVAGRVEAVGSEVTRFRPGDDVFGVCDGALAEYACGRQHRFAAKPAGVSFEQAAAVPGAGYVALQGLRDAGRLRAGQRVLVIGAGGGVGTLAVQLARAFGARVTGVCGPGKADLVRSIGAEDVVDYTREDFADGSRHYDLILDTAGHRPLSLLRRALTPRGTLVIVGSEGGGRWLQGVDRQLRALLLTPFVRQRLGAVFSAEREKDLLLLRELVDTGAVTPIVDRTFPLGEVPAAIRYLREGHASGKVVITVS